MSKGIKYNSKLSSPLIFHETYPVTFSFLYHPKAATKDSIIETVLGEVLKTVESTFLPDIVFQLRKASKDHGFVTCKVN